MNPLQYLTKAAGHRAAITLPLTWWLISVSCVVMVIIGAFVLIGVMRGARKNDVDAISHVPVARDENGVKWIYWGVGISFLPLVATLAWTLVVLTRLTAAPDPAATIEVTGYQWWWNIRYLNSDRIKSFRTANEVHIPVGEPVKVELKSADVIHSFWAPALAGKTDAIPGRTNALWIEADKPGRYRGQCSEYCGAEHALMSFYIIADSSEAFQKWRDHQGKDAPSPKTQAALRGEGIFVDKCGKCHEVRGTQAIGQDAPDLTHLMSRKTIAAGALPNNIGSVMAWIFDPHANKPGAKMPATALKASEMSDLRAYMETLK